MHSISEQRCSHSVRAPFSLSFSLFSFAIILASILAPDDIPGYENFKDAIKTIIGIAPAENTTSEAEAAPADEKPTEAAESGEAVPEIDMEEL